ncbi:ubiquitin-like protein Pup [Rothia aeria F0184]|jgi:pup-like protein|nr:ubiquitin-like protein Pup [Rothia aeria F0184]KGJ34630.1 ubiquitin [Rothia aeria]
MSASEPLGQEQAQEQELTLASHSAVQDVSEVDDLLDEIDGLLAENAEDFVTGFVQKGGQ